MKKDIHPKYYDPAVITCSCGAVFETGSTKEKMQVEICSACHPFYTGKKKLVDAAGRVDRFKKLAEKATVKKLARIDSAKRTTRQSRQRPGKNRKTTAKKTAASSR